MKFPQRDYPVIAISPQIANGGNAVASTVDTRGYEYATFHVSIGDTAAALTALKVQESTSGLGEWADVSGAALTGGDLPTANSECRTFSIYVPMTVARKRFLQLIATAGSGNINISAICVLSGAEVTPVEGTVSGFSGFSGWTH